MTHWQPGKGSRGRSLYCYGFSECPAATHRLPAYWKGYLGAELWFPERSLWFPIVLEVSESCELDMRGRYKRGQQWELTRAAEVKDKKRPVVARYLCSDDPAGLPPDLPVMEILQQLYHCADVQLGVSNPMPGRVIVAPRAGDAPPTQKKEEYLSPAESQALLKKLAEERDRRNGKGGKS